MWCVVESRDQAAAAGEATDGQRVDARLRAASEHDICFPRLYEPCSVAEGVSARRAGCRDSVVWTLGSGQDLG